MIDKWCPYLQFSRLTQVFYLFILSSKNGSLNVKLVVNVASFLTLLDVALLLSMADCSSERVIKKAE